MSCLCPEDGLWIAICPDESAEGVNHGLWAIGAVLTVLATNDP